VIDAPPGSGPKLHKHPYEEVFVVQEGEVTFTAGQESIEVTAGQVVVVAAGSPHKFVNSGAGRLRQVDIHSSERFVTGWLEDGPGDSPSASTNETTAVFASTRMHEKRRRDGR
jgi:mannose-6-phosphate isomerase-like protein (cupin superfamily)